MLVKIPRCNLVTMYSSILAASLLSVGTEKRLSKVLRFRSRHVYYDMMDPHSTHALAMPICPNLGMMVIASVMMLMGI